MPPRSALTGSFSVADAGIEVVCPLKNQDGSTCRKRCFGEKRYRSMQEHIRRAHPLYYIPKLPANEDSFLRMTQSPPAIKNEFQDTSRTNAYMNSSTSGYDPNAFSPSASSTNTSPTLQQSLRRSSTLMGATTLAHLHDARPEEWEPEQVIQHPASPGRIGISANNAKTQEPFPLMDNDNYLPSYFISPGPPDTLSGLMSGNTSPQFPGRGASNSLRGTPLGRTPSLQPSFFKTRGNRRRKSSVTDNARKPKHERDKSRDLKRFSLGHDKKPFSAEPSPFGNRWEDLLDAAASATEADSRDLTPIPQSPRLSATPFAVPHIPLLQSYAASPLQNSMLPHTPDGEPSSYVTPHLEPFPSVEEATFDPRTHDSLQRDVPQTSYHHLHHSSNGSATSNPFATFPHANHQQHSSGSSFHIPSSNLSSSPNNNLSLTNTLTNNTSLSTANNALYSVQYSPVLQPQNYSPVMSQHQLQLQHQHQQRTPPSVPPSTTPPLVQHYCAACHRVTPLTSSYACTECICGICRECVDVLVGMGPERGARCPRCKIVGGRFKPFMLDIR